MNEQELRLRALELALQNVTYISGPDSYEVLSRARAYEVYIMTGRMPNDKAILKEIGSK